MIPKTQQELAELIDMLRRKHVAHFELGDLKLVLGEPPGDEEDGQNDEAAEVNPATGLTPSQEAELFHSSE